MMKILISKEYFVSDKIHDVMYSAFVKVHVFNIIF